MLGWEVVVPTQTKAREFTDADFSKEPRVLSTQDFADVCSCEIERLLLAYDRLVAVKLSGQRREELLQVWTGIAALETPLKTARNQIGNRPISSILSGQLENLNSTREDVGQAQVNIERVVQSAAAAKATNRLALIAHPDPVDKERTKCQRQKLYKILIDCGRILVGMESAEEKNDPIQTPGPFSRCLELQQTV
jgi:hypothetical protein